jgi:polyhydroxyalkanoate synthesis regulator protein
MAKQQLHMIEGAFRGLVPGAQETAKPKPADKDDLAALKAEMAALKAKLDRLDD